MVYNIEVGSNSVFILEAGERARTLLEFDLTDLSSNTDNDSFDKV